jgi:hypothetical protein
MLGHTIQFPHTQKFAVQEYGFLIGRRWLAVAEKWNKECLEKASGVDVGLDHFKIPTFDHISKCQ